MPQDLTPAGARRAMLRHYGLEEEWLRYLRSLGPDEAKWLVEHEHTVALKFHLERRDFILNEVLPKAVEQAKPAKPTEVVGFRHPTIHTSGDQLG